MPMRVPAQIRLNYGSSRGHFFNTDFTKELIISGGIQGSVRQLPGATPGDVLSMVLNVTTLGAGPSANLATDFLITAPDEITYTGAASLIGQQLLVNWSPTGGMSETTRERGVYRPAGTNLGHVTGLFNSIVRTGVAQGGTFSVPGMVPSDSVLSVLEIATYPWDDDVKSNYAAGTDEIIYTGAASQVLQTLWIRYALGTSENGGGNEVRVTPGHTFGRVASLKTFAGLVFLGVATALGPFTHFSTAVVRANTKIGSVIDVTTTPAVKLDETKFIPVAQDHILYRGTELIDHYVMFTMIDVYP